jgi:hypothetical protein
MSAISSVHRLSPPHVQTAIRTYFGASQVLAFSSQSETTVKLPALHLRRAADNWIASLRQYLFDHMPMHVREPAIDAVVVVGQLLMI